MGSHPFNLGLRFALEMAALVSLGIWGSRQGEGIFSILLALGIPVFAAALWGIFTVPNDPSRSGKSPVPVSGIVRLIYEGVFFGSATWAWFSIGSATLSLIFGITVIVHYILSYDRVQWLVATRNS
jgi:hypothetical protein